jgi:hypothetical protein
VKSRWTIQIFQVRPTCSARGLAEEGRTFDVRVDIADRLFVAPGGGEDRQGGEATREKERERQVRGLRSRWLQRLDVESRTRRSLVRAPQSRPDFPDTN